MPSRAIPSKLMPPQAEMVPLYPITRARCLVVARCCGLIVSALGLCALAGWLFHCRALMTVLPGLVAMKPNTAIALCLAGLGLFLFTRPINEQDAAMRALSTAFAIVVALIGALTLGEYAVGFNFGIDELFFKDGISSGAPGRMAPISAANFVCLGSALVCLRFPKRKLWSHALTGCAAFTSLLTVLGYFYGVSTLYQAGHFTAVALHTAVAFILLCIGVWCAASEHGFMRIVTDPGPSGKLARRFGLASIVLPFLIGWLRVQGTRHGWFGVEMGVVLVAMANAAIFTSLVWIGASTLRKAERRQAQAQQGLRESEERLHLVVEQLTEGLVISDLEGRMLHWNRAALDMHGIPTREEGLRLLPEFAEIFEMVDLEGRVLTVDKWPLPRIFRGETLQDVEVKLRRLDQGWTRVLSYGGATVQGADGKPMAFLTITDITKQKEAETEAEAANEKFHRSHLELEVRVIERTSELAKANAGLQEQILERAKAEHANQQIMDHSLDVICTFDAEGRFTQVSRACEAMWGYRPENLLGRPYLEWVHPDDREKTLAIAAAIMGGRAEKEFENRYLRPDGSAVPVLWTAQWSEQQQIMFCVARDMTARKQVESELLRAKEAAEAASRSKSEFLANMSHEIRTPMNGIIGMTELVLDTPLDRSQREYLGMARTSATTLLGLINDILDFSKIEAGKLELEAIAFNLRDCIGTMLKPLGIRADQKGLELTADIAADVPYQVIGDPMRLRQILINLTDNAIKFTRQGDVMLRVAVESTSEEEHCLHFSVTDTGIGIPAEKQALIFEAFAQADGTTTRTYGGTGLGLAIASRLVEQMRGRIWVESIPGDGTTFHFAARFAAGKAPPGASIRPLQPRRLEGLSVLVVDDNAVNRRILGGMLTNWRMKPAVVASGEEALVEMQRAAEAGSPYPLVILDGMMPEMDGFMVAEKIRANAEISGATMMMLSSAMPPGAAARCAELGVASYLTKPVNQSDLIEAILIAIGVEEPEVPVRPPPPAGAPANGLRILLAEDNLINRALATGILEKRGCSLVHAANGREAVEAAGREAFDLIFMDVQMPEMDGLEATQRIREAEQPTGRHTPIAAMTAHAMAGDRERFLASGMDEYISKPLLRTELFALIERISGGRNLAVPAATTDRDGDRPLAAIHVPTAKTPAKTGLVFSRAELLDQVDGDEMLMGRMIALFHENTPRLLDDIRASIARRSSGDVARSTHALLSSLGVIGALGSRHLTAEIAAFADEENYESILNVFAALEGEIAKVDAALTGFTIDRDEGMFSGDQRFALDRTAPADPYSVGRAHAGVALFDGARSHRQQPGLRPGEPSAQATE